MPDERSPLAPANLADVTNPTVTGPAAFAGLVTITKTGVALKFLTNGAGLGNSQVFDFIAPDGATVRARVGFQSNNDGVFYMGPREAADSVAITTGAGLNAILISSLGAAAILAGFGCNGQAAQAAAASGGALAAYGAGANGFDTAGHAQSLYNMVVAIRAALVANGIMS